MGHIAQERTLCSVCALGGADRLLKSLIYFLVARAVRQYDYIFFLALNITAQCNYVEPAYLARLFMYVFSVPLALTAGSNTGQLSQNQVGIVICGKLCYLAYISTRVAFRNAHELIYVRTDVIHTECIGIQHKENIVYVYGKL